MVSPWLRLKRGLSRRADEFLRTSRLLRPWRIDRAVDAENVTDGSITHLQVVVPAQERVSLNTNAHDRPFLEVCKYFRDGFYSRSSVVVCEVPLAFCHIFTGMVCTRRFEAINDSQMAYRMTIGPAEVGNRVYRIFKGFKPLHARRLTGTYATIGNVFMGYWGHWIFDCLPRLYSLEKASQGEPVILLVPEGLAPSWYESLDAVLPANFKIQQLPGASWVLVDRLLLASYASGRANSHMPWEFYDFVRRACFTKFGLSLENEPTDRIYISRAETRHRRVRNENALIELLGRYGFRSVALEKLSFRQQVELFHRAEIVIAADGSNWANMIFAGRIKIFVLYASATPNLHWFTAAKGLGQEHYFLAANQDSPHADFEVDLAEVERVLIEQMGLRRTDAA